MRKILFILLFCFAFQFNFGQQSYTIDGETLELKTEVEGSLDLLWNTFDGQYRYFVRTEDGAISELKNIKTEDNEYLAEYKSTLSNLTGGLDTEDLKFTLYGLRNYIDAYNATVDSGYISNATESDVQLRLAVFGGITNNPFVGNPDNTKTPLIGAELEIFEANVMPRHSGFLQARHAFESDDFQYSTTELSLGYRFKFINTSSFSLFGQVKLATLNFSNATVVNDEDLVIDINETSFDVPFIFGIGSDIKVGENSYITIIYGELFALLLDNQGNFSTDIAVGYKFNL